MSHLDSKPLTFAVCHCKGIPCLGPSYMVYDRRQGCGVGPDDAANLEDLEILDSESGITFGQVHDRPLAHIVCELLNRCYDRVNADGSATVYLEAGGMVPA